MLRLRQNLFAFFLFITAICLKDVTEARSEMNKYEDKFNCKSDDGRIIQSSERILVLSPNDYYFSRHANLDNLDGKYIPKSLEKNFSNVITLSGMLYDESGGKFLHIFQC